MQGFPVGSGQTWFLGDKAGRIQPACTRRKCRCCLFRLPVPWPDEKEKEQLEKERKMQEAIIELKHKFGKNAILKGMNLQEGGTTIERNGQIGGHKA